MKHLLFTIVLICPLGHCDAVPSESEAGLSLTIPEGYYAGPGNRWPTLRELEDRARELSEGTRSFASAHNQEEYLKLHLAGEVYYMIVLDGGLQLLSAWSEDYEAKLPMKLGLNDGTARSLSQSKFDFFMRTENKKGLWTFSITVIPDHENAAYANLPPDSIVYYWEGFANGSSQPSTHWTEAILPSGQVVVPDGKGGWNPAPEDSCWTCNPDLIPSEFSFDEDPVLVELLK